MATNRKRPLSNDEVEPDSHTIAKTLLKGECRRTYRKQMRPKDFKEHGCSTNCLGCEWIQNGLYGLIGYRNHTDLCRQRMEEALRVETRIPLRCDELTKVKESEVSRRRPEKVQTSLWQDAGPRTLCSAKKSTLNCADQEWKKHLESRRR